MNAALAFCVRSDRALEEIAARAFYALHDTRTPVAIGIGSMVLNVCLSVILRVPLGFAGLALANTLATLLEMALMIWLLSRQLGGLELPQIGSTFARASLASDERAAAAGGSKGGMDQLSPSAWLALPPALHSTRRRDHSTHA
jgi:putative peptidoglycan lipid II flippase